MNKLLDGFYREKRTTLKYAMLTRRTAASAYTCTNNNIVGTRNVLKLEN